MLENTEIGKRIAHFRTTAGLSQEDVAKAIGISRPSLAQMELGNRNVTAMELSALAEILNFSMDEILSKDFKYSCIPATHKKDDTIEEIRISVPELNLPKFQNLILYILERCAGKPNVGETVLNKLLYFADFNYYEIYEEHLSGAMYRKFAKGPVPKDITDILNEMIATGMLQAFNAKYFGYNQKRYFPLVASDTKLFNGAEIEVINRVIDQLSGMSATEISLYSHGDIPWKASSDRQVIDYELAFYREAPYSVRTYNDSQDD